MLSLNYVGVCALAAALAASARHSVCLCEGRRGGLEACMGSACIGVIVFVCYLVITCDNLWCITCSVCFGSVRVCSRALYLDRSVLFECPLVVHMVCSCELFVDVLLTCFSCVAQLVCT